LSPSAFIAFEDSQEPRAALAFYIMPVLPPVTEICLSLRTILKGLIHPHSFSLI
jgi:hypothetical protein